MTSPTTHVDGRSEGCGCEVEFNVVLEHVGVRKIAVVRALLDVVPDLYLESGVRLVESVPTPILERVTTAVAQAAAQKLGEAGAAVSVVTTPGHTGIPREAPRGATEGAGEEFDVVLEDGGQRRTEVIEAIRETFLGLGLKETQDLVESAPTTILERVSRKAAVAVAEPLAAAGATISVIPVRRVRLVWS
jgi:large subunit ribosomal protein L7/L12